MATTAEQIKQLRELTGAGVLDAKRTLEEHQGDFDKALAVLKEKGLKRAEKKAERATRQGLVETYVHAGGLIGVMVEVNCETDFVARNEAFKELAHNLALQIAAQSPKFVSQNDIPAEVLSEQQRIYAEAAKAEGKSDAIVEKIVQGKLASWIKESCLLSQSFIRDDSQTIHALVQATIMKFGENIVVRRFARFALGE
ncbi:MAG: translation elongation factor Ts [Chloroflexi bacterium]|nr:translation elongation factor Ts [Chloroflexota bacterium]